MIKIIIILLACYIANNWAIFTSEDYIQSSSNKIKRQQQMGLKQVESAFRKHKNQCTFPFTYNNKQYLACISPKKGTKHGYFSRSYKLAEICPLNHDFLGSGDNLKVCNYKDCVQYRNKGHYFVSRNMVAPRAQKFCKAHGMSLVIVKNDAHRLWLLDEIRKRSFLIKGFNFYINGVYNQTFKSFFTFEGEYLTYVHFAPGTSFSGGMYNHVGLNPNTGNFEEMLNVEAYAFVCESPRFECASPEWGEWQAWSDASATCDMANIFRVRQCLNPPDDLIFQPRDCKGDFKETVTFFTNVTCPKWDKWSTWTRCTSTCGPGIQSRQRKCKAWNTYPTCEGHPNENKKCNLRKCPIDGRFGPWESWSSCDRTCGSGSKKRIRSCNMPAPAFGGKPCNLKDATEVEKCFRRACPVQRKWSRWSIWTDCSATCGKASKSRTRECIDTIPNFSFGICPGLSVMTRQCRIISCEGESGERGKKFDTLGDSGFGGSGSQSSVSSGIGSTARNALIVFGILCALVVFMFIFSITKNTLFKRNSEEIIYDSSESSSDEEKNLKN